MLLRAHCGSYMFEIRMELEQAPCFLAGVQHVVDELFKIHRPDGCAARGNKPDPCCRRSGRARMDQLNCAGGSRSRQALSDSASGSGRQSLRPTDT